METTQKKGYLAKALMIFGIAAIITSLIDLAVVILPPHFYNPEWIGGVTKIIADKSIIPALGVIFILAGIYMMKKEEGESKCLLIKENLTGIFSLLFALGLIISTVLYSLSIGTVGDNIISNAKQSTDQVKEKLNKKFEIIKPQIPEDQIEKITKEKDAQLLKINSQLEIYIEQTKKKFIKSKIRISINLLAFILTFCFIGVSSFLSSLKELKLLRFKK